MKKKAFLALAISAIGIILISGCWNYREINNLSIVAGAAIDINEKGNYEVTVEIINPKSKGKEAELEPLVLGAGGQSIFDAIRNIITRSGRRLYWSHAKVIIISEKLAKEDILTVVDWVYGDGEARPDMWFLVAREKKASDIFNVKTEVESAVSYQIDNSLKNHKSNLKFSKMELWRFIRRLSGEGFESILPTVNKTTFGRKEIIQVYGSALFQGSKMVGWLNGSQTQTLSWITMQDLAGVIVVPAKNVQSKSTENKSTESKSTENKSTEHKPAKDQPYITYEMLGTETKIKPRIINNKPQIDLEIKMSLKLIELDKTSPDYSKDEVVKKLESSVSKYLKARTQKLISKVQKEFKVDVFGFGSILFKEMPKEWGKFDTDWNNYFSKMKVNVKIKASIQESALTYKPIIERN